MDAPPDFPTLLDIDLSSSCNLRCSFCHLSHFDPRQPGQVSLEQFDRWLGPHLARLQSLTLFSKFEPTTCRDLVPILRRVNAHGLEIYFSTNGLKMSDELLAEMVGRVRFLTLSVTGFDAAAYRRHMGVEGLERVEGNLRRLRDEKKRRGTELPILRLSTVAMSDTFAELTRAVDFAHRHEMAAGVQVTSLIAHHATMVPQMPMMQPEAFLAAARVARDHARALGIPFVLQSGELDDNDRETRELGHRPCRLPWQRLSLQPNGEVYPCPVSYTPVGHLEREDLAAIWRGEPLARFRLGVNDEARMNPECRVCTHCRTKSVRRRESNDFSQAELSYAGMTRKSRPPEKGASVV
ncbi:MAG: radical SAM protein [Magnetococcales bacterium]|nr:radical SAM protein [Magnetococcales bacterium]